MIDTIILTVTKCINCCCLLVHIDILRVSCSKTDILYSHLCRMWHSPVNLIILLSSPMGGGYLSVSYTICWATEVEATCIEAMSCNHKFI